MARSEIRKNLKFRRLQKRLGIPAPYVIGLLECMWHVGYEAGSDLLGSDEDVEMAAEWPGTPGEFVKALKNEKFIDKRGKDWFIHDLFEHAPEFVKKRMSRKRELRSSNDKYLRENSADNGRRTADNGGQTADNGNHVSAIVRQTADNGGSNYPTQPNTTQHNPTEERARAEGVEENPEEKIKIPTCDHPHFRAAWESFDRWSHRAPPVGRGSGLSEFANEHTKIAELLAALDECPPIVRGNSESVKQPALAALAAEGLAAEGKAFKGIKFAIACVKNRLGDWARDGESQADLKISRTQAMVEAGQRQIDEVILGKGGAS